MKKYACIAAFILFINISCKNRSTSSDSIVKEDSAAKEYYPIGSFIKTQVNKLDSLPLAVIKYTTVGNKTDTAIIDKKDFAAIAVYFATPDITNPEIAEQIEETPIIDASLGTITLIYTAKNDTLSLRKADVLLKQDDSQVRTVYIEKSKPVAEGIIIQKMLWTADKNFQVTTVQRSKESPEKVTIEKYIWDDIP